MIESVNPLLQESPPPPRRWFPEGGSLEQTPVRSRARTWLIVLCLFLYLPVAYHYGWALRFQESVDFPSYYQAARVTFVEGNSPYGLHAFDAASASLGRKVHPFLYPPPSLLAFWPLARLSPAAAHGWFLALSHLCFLGSVWLLLTRLANFPQAARLRDIGLGIGIVYLFCFDASLATLGLGQINLLALFFICLALAGLRKSAPAWMTALPLTAAVLLKTYPILLLLLLISRRKYREVALTCAFLALFGAISALVLPDQVWLSWAAEILPQGGYANNQVSAAAPWNQNINGFISRLLLVNPFSQPLIPASWLARPLATILCALVGLVTLLTSWRVRQHRSGSETLDGEVAVFLLMIFLIAPLSWDHHLVYILPALVQIICLILSGSIRAKLTALLVGCLFLIAWKLPFDDPSLMNGWWTLLISIKFYPVLLLWAFFVLRTWRLTAGRVAYV